MKHILLTQNQLALVDNEDYDWLNQWKWYAQWNRGTESFYAARHSKQIKGKRTTIQMHRLILNLLEYYAGLFDIKEDAARAYNNKALELHGEFARLNIVL